MLTTHTSHAGRPQPRVIHRDAPATAAASQPQHREEGRAWALVAGLVGYVGTLAFGMMSLGVMAALMH